MKKSKRRNFKEDCQKGNRKILGVAEPLTYKETEFILKQFLEFGQLNQNYYAKFEQWPVKFLEDLASVIRIEISSKARLGYI